MKRSQRTVAAQVTMFLLVLGASTSLAAGSEEVKKTPEALLAEVRVLALTAKLQFGFEQVASLKEFADKASAAAIKVEKANADSWDGVGDDIWKAVWQTLNGEAVSSPTMARIEREVGSNRRQIEPLLDATNEALDSAVGILSEEQRTILAVGSPEAAEELAPVIPVSTAQMQGITDAILSVRSLSKQDFSASRERLAVSLAGQVVPAGPEAEALAQRFLAILDAVYALSDGDFQAMREQIPEDVARYLGIQAQETPLVLASDRLNGGDLADLLVSPESPGILQALLEGASGDAGVGTSPEEVREGAETAALPGEEEAGTLPTGDMQTTPRVSRSWQWERALAALDCLRLVTTLSLSQEQMQAMSSPLNSLFKGKLPEDRKGLLQSKADEMLKIRDEFWAAYLSQPSADLIERAEKLVVSLRTPAPEPQAAQSTLDQLKRLLIPEQVALIDWGDSSLFPGAILGPDPAAIAQQDAVLNYIHQRLLQARAMPARSRKGRLPPQYGATRWRLTLADDVVRDLTLLRPVSPQEYPQLVSAVQDAIFTALSMSPGEFDMNGYGLAASLMERFGLGVPPPLPPPPPPPVLESEFDRIMLDPASQQVFYLGAGGG